MIKASEAQANVINYKVMQYNKVKEVADEILETMSKSIEYHSRNGFNSADFMPYGKSQFPCEQALQTASEIFEKVFMSNGYEIVKNDWQNNILKIKW